MKHRILFLSGIILLTNFFSHGQNVKENGNTISIPSILFICEHGAGRSAIAAALFNKIAKEKKLNYKAIFRGISPDSVIGPGIKKGLIEDGFDIHGWKPVSVSPNDINNAYRVVRLDCLLTEKDSTAQPGVLWGNIPISQGYEAARDELEKRIGMLIAELQNEKPAKN